MGIKILAASMILFVIVCLICIWHASTHFHKVFYRLSSDKISKPVRLVLLTDLHDKKFGDRNKLLIKAVKEESPDAVLVAGDMLTAHLVREKTAEHVIRELAAEIPVYYGPGNHESKMKWDRELYGDLYEQYTEDIRACGAEFLVNGSAGISGIPVRIYGLDIAEAYFKRFKQTPMKADYVEWKLGPLDNKVFNILLAHNPMYFENYVNWKPDLVLSGHVHGGLVRLPFLGGVIAPNLHLFPKYDGGLFQKDNTTMIISRGLGIHSVEFRMWNPGELVVIEITPAKE